MPTAATYTVKIAGVAVNAVAGSLSVENMIGQRSTGSVTVWGNLGVSYAYGTQLQVFDTSGALAFSGYITKDKAYKEPGARQGHGVLLHDLTVVDNCYRADKRLAFYTNVAVSAGSIVADLVRNYLAAEGVSYSASSVASGAFIEEVVWNGRQISQCLDWLAKTSGYWWDINDQGVLYFLPYGGVSAPITLDGSTVDSAHNLSVVYGNDQYVNRQFVRGAYAQLGKQTETFHGDGVRRNFTLSYELATATGADLVIKLNGVTQQYDAKGASGSQWYVAVGDAVIAQDTGQAVLQSTDTLTVAYKGRYPIIAVASNNTLVATQKSREGGGTGYVEAVFADTRMHSQAGAFQVAGALLGHYGSDVTTLQWDMRASDASGLTDGQLITVNLSDFGLSNKQMLISGVEIGDQRDGFTIWYHLTAVGSPYDVANWQTFFQHLMNQQYDPSELSDTSDGTVLASVLADSATIHARATLNLRKTVAPHFPMTFPFALA